MLDNEPPDTGPAAPQGAPESALPAASEPVAAGEPLDAYSAAVVGAVEQVGPAVVSVYVGGAAEAERARGGAGSGVVVTPDGYLLTNEHVVQRVTEARVTFVDGRTVPAAVSGRDPATDLAVLRAQAGALPYARRAPEQRLRAGQLVIAVGNPFGFESTVSAGNPGGPLVDSLGRVAGINTAIIAMAQGIGFAIPASTAQWVLTEILTQGRVRRAWLGIGARDRPLDLRLVRALGLRGQRAVEVLSLESSGPAAASDLRSGDLIVRVNDADVEGIDALHRQLARVPPDTTLTLQIVRRTQLRTIALTVREPPA